MWGAADVGSQVAGYGPIMVATAGLITALVAGASRRDKAQESRAARLDAAADTALGGLQAAYDRAEAERARWETAALTERARADSAESTVTALQAELAALRRDRHERSSRRPTER